MNGNSASRYPCVSYVLLFASKRLLLAYNIINLNYLSVLKLAPLLKYCEMFIILLLSGAGFFIILAFFQDCFVFVFILKTWPSFIN